MAAGGSDDEDGTMPDVKDRGTTYRNSSSDEEDLMGAPPKEDEKLDEFRERAKNWTVGILAEAWGWTTREVVIILNRTY
jgi:hypothetical protein